MKKVERTFYKCEQCEKEYESMDGAMFCEQFCMVMEAFGDKIDADKFSPSEKERTIKGLARVFRKLWDKDGSNRQFYVELSDK